MTDADASMATAATHRRLEPCCKRHTAVDDVRGVVLDVAVTTGETNAGETIEAQVDEVRKVSEREIVTVAADAGCSCAKVYGGLKRRGIDPLLPAKRAGFKSRVSLSRFRYDARHTIVKCPRGKILHPVHPSRDGHYFRSRVSDCAHCTLRGDCLPKTRANKTVVTPNDYPALLRARRRRARWNEEDRRVYQRHPWRSEGLHGEAKTWHGLGRAVRRRSFCHFLVHPDRRGRPRGSAGRASCVNAPECIAHDGRRLTSTRSGLTAGFFNSPFVDAPGKASPSGWCSTAADKGCAKPAPTIERRP